MYTAAMHARTVHNVADLVKITALTAVFRDVQTPFFNTLDLKSTEKLLYNFFFVVVGPMMHLRLGVPLKFSLGCLNYLLCFVMERFQSS